MFDSPFDDWKPGLPVLFGCPLHGRIDLPLRSTDFQPRLTTANGRVITLPSRSTQPLNLRRHQAGNVVRFRSPAASDGNRSPEQLAADQAAGREWRADALYNPREGWIYGRQVGLLDSWVSWIYACWINGRWETRYISFLGQRDVRVKNEPTIRRAYGTSAPFVTIQAQMPEGAPPDDLFASWVLMDQVPDGSRAILARFTSSGRLSVDHIEAGAQGAGDWCDSPSEFWEMALSTTPEGAHSATLRPLRSQQQTAGTITGRNAPVSRKQWRASVDWVDQGPAPGGMRYFQGTPKVEESLDDIGHSVFMEDFCNYSTTFGYSGRVIAMYYENGVAVEVTADCLTVEEVSSTFDATYTSDPERVIALSMQTQATVLEEGRLSMTVNAQRSYTSTTTLTIRNNGTKVSDVSASWSGEQAATYSYSGEIDFNIPYNFVNGTDSGSSTGSYSVEMKVGGQSVFQESDSGSDGNIIFFGQPVRLVVPPGISSPTAPWVTVNNDFYTEIPALLLGPVRYCALMPAAAGLVYVPLPSASRTLHIGGGALPYGGGAFSGVTSRSGLAQEVFGSFNPVTRQYLRDTPNPVCWL